MLLINIYMNTYTNSLMVNLLKETLLITKNAEQKDELN